MSTAKFGERAGRRWASTYTRSLTPDVAQRRRDEIESDMYEHAHDREDRGAAFQFEVLGRVLSGVPADLSWRRAVHGSRLRSGGDPIPMSRFSKVADVALVVFVVIGVAIPVASIPIAGSEFSSAFSIQVAVAVLLAAAMVLGMNWRTTRPVAATWLLVVGAAAPAVAWYWLPPTYLVSFMIIVLTLVTAPQARQRAAAAA